jgi:tetratricopeptide (TPR) repeat protein
VTEGYSLRDVVKLLGLSRSIVGRLIEAGFVTPGRGPRREYRFSFQDLVLLRAAQGLVDAKIPSTRILRALRRLRAKLPERMPLTGLRIEAAGDDVVVTEGSAQWRPEDGQYVFGFQVESDGRQLAFLAPADKPRAAPTAPWFEQGLAFESADVERACDAYRRAIGADRRDLGAYVNLGRLLHGQGRLQEAEKVYREGRASCGPDGTLLFNLGVLLEDRGRTKEAIDSYRAALASEPDLADAHFNLARLYETQGRRQDAVRHLSAFRKLTGTQ